MHGNTKLKLVYICFYGPGSSVGIATELRAGRSWDRILVGRYFPPVQTGPGAHPASCTTGTGSFPGVKYGRAVLLTPHPLLVPWSRKNRAIPLPTLLENHRSCNGVTLRIMFWRPTLISPYIWWLIAQIGFTIKVGLYLFLKTNTEIPLNLVIYCTNWHHWVLAWSRYCLHIY